MEFPIDADGYIRCERAISLGYDRHSLSRAARAGELVPVAPGIYAVPADRTPEALHRTRVLAAQSAPDAAVSHGSAAVMRGLSMLSPDLSALDLTSATSGRGYRRRHRHIHPGPLEPSDVEEVDGIWLTTLERTAFDVARTSPHGFAGALAVFDAALRMGADPAVMSGYGREPRTGVGVARRALAFADPRSENPGESWSRAQMIAAGITPPTLQREIFDRRGNFVARTDFDWVDENGVVTLVGEFDGLGKYLKYLRPGESPEQVIKREKTREGRLQDLGIVITRWLFTDLVAQRMAPRLIAQLRTLRLPTPTPIRAVANPALGRPA